MVLSPRLKRCLPYAPLLLLGADSFLHLLQVMAGRIGYRYELEWMEGAVLQQVLRVLHGQPLYGEPGLDFVPALYMPLYYYVSALSATLFGENLFALRLVSAAAALATHWLVFLIVERVSMSRLAALLALLLFASTYPHTAFWFDVARVDSLWTCLLAATVYALLCLRDRPDNRHLAWLVVAFLTAFAAKQSSLFLLPFLCLALWCWTSLQLAFRFGAMVTAGALVLVALLQGLYGEHFFFYVFRMASTHGVTLYGFRRFGLDILLSVVCLAFTACLYPWLAGGNWRNRLGWLLLLAGFTCLSMLSRAYAGAFFNVLMPLHCCLAIFAALAFAALVARAGEKNRASAWLAVGLVLLALAAEMYRFRYDPAAQWPSDNARTMNDRLLLRIARVDGPVCVTAHGYLGWLAGKDFCAHHTQVSDLVTGSDPALAQQLRNDARRRILSGYYSVIVLDREKELNDLGLQLSQIPYKVEPLAHLPDAAQFPVNGHSPSLWLQYDGLAVPSEIAP